MAGLLHKVRNKLTGKRFLVSTIKKDDATFETAVFAANFLYLPQGFRLTNPCFVRQSSNSEDADELHQNLSQGLVTEYPEWLFQEYSKA